MRYAQGLNKSSCEGARNYAMKQIDEIVSRDNGRSIQNVIDALKEKTTTPPSWSEIKMVLMPENHKIVDDKIMRRDRKVNTDSGEFVEKAARMPLPMELLLAKRINQFSFTIPVKREYSNTDTDVRRQIANAMEAIYQEADIDTVNMDRGFQYFSSCEMYTLWYTVKKPNSLYGFNSEYKLKCRVFSPMKDDIELYPLLDEYGDMLAMSIYYKKRILDEDVEFFETWTAEKHFKWRKSENTDWQDEIYSESEDGQIKYGDDIIINKIPGIYGWRKNPIYADGTPELREDAEYKHSEDSDILAYNVAPLIKVVGRMTSDEKKFESRRLIRVEQGGNVEYVAWNQATEASTNHIQRDIDWFWMFNQMPDISFKNLQSLGNIGYDARQMMLTDAFLKIGEETKPFLEFFRRESNVIKAFLKSMNTTWSEADIDAVKVKHIISPYIPKDESYEIDKRIKANGGKPIESQHESIKRWGKSPDVEKTIKEINDEVREQQSISMNDIMTGAI